MAIICTNIRSCTDCIVILYCHASTAACYIWIACNLDGGEYLREDRVFKHLKMRRFLFTVHQLEF